jgi:hypothetical protein
MVDDPKCRDEYVMFALLSELRAYCYLIDNCVKIKDDVIAARIRERQRLYVRMNKELKKKQPQGFFGGPAILKEIIDHADTIESSWKDGIRRDGGPGQ